MVYSRDKESGKHDDQKQGREHACSSHKSITTSNIAER